MRILKHTKDLIKIVVAFTISSCMKLNKNNKDIWLISERKDEAEDILTSLGLKCYFKGNTDGVVAGQNIEAGSLIKTSSYIKLTLQ